jgi:hypothetical protein
MEIPGLVYVLTALIAVLATAAAGIGFFRREGAPYEVTTLRGQQTQLFGQGVYRYDTLFTGAGFRGQDLVTLVFGVPLLVIASLLSSGGSLAGHLLLIGALGYFLYVYLTMAVGAAYNRLFLVYVALFSASLFAFVMAFAAVDLAVLADRLGEDAPQRGLAVFLLVSGGVTLFVWGAPLVTALIQDTAPDRMDTYTTSVTFALDLAIITPAALAAGVLVWQGAALGTLIAVPLLVLIILLLPLIALMTVFQWRAGVQFSPPEVIGPIVGFMVLGVFAIGLIVALLGAVG